MAGYRQIASKSVLIGLIAGLMGLGVVHFGGYGTNLVSALDRSTYQDLEAFTNVLAWPSVTFHLLLSCWARPQLGPGPLWPRHTWAQAHLSRAQMGLAHATKCN